MSDLPANWIETEIGNLCSLKNGRAFKPTEWQTSGLPIVRIQNLNNPAAKYNYFQGDVDERNRLCGGELLFAWSGTPGTSFGAHVWRGGEAVLNQHIFRVDFDEALLDKRFFRSAINQKLSELIDVAHGGVGLRHVTKGVFEKTLVALPLRPEQTRIANQLDTLLTRIQSCNDRFDAIPALLKRFRQTVLDAAIKGNLIEVQHEGGDNRSSSVAFQDLCLEQKHSFGIGPFGSDLKVADYRRSGVPLIFVRDIRAQNFGGAGTKFVSLEKAQLLMAHTVLPGDLIVTKMGDPPGDVAIYPNDRPPAVMTADVVRMRVNPEVANAQYIGYWFQSLVGKQLVSTITAGVAQRKISLARLRTIRIALPTTTEQAEIVSRVEALFTLAARIEARATAARTHAKRLSPLVLAKAFRGELVPQNAQHEPAIDLLKRLATAGTQTPQKTNAKAAVRASRKVKSRDEA